jgi:hypothetical protein
MPRRCLPGRSSLFRWVLPLFALSPLFLATACLSMRESHPERTATEQLLISHAAEKAAAALDFGVAPGTRVFVEAANFEGVDAKYAIAAIRAAALRQDLALADDKGQAAAIIEIRAGALSIDQRDMLVGIPDFDVPIPLAGDLGIPEIALYKNDKAQGVAKFSAATYGARDGKLIAISTPPARSAFAEQTVLLFFISWSDDDLDRPED